MKAHSGAWVAWALLGIGCPLRAAAQEPTLRVAPLAGEVRLDGLPDEAAWRLADSLTDVTQREPTSGAPATDSTVVRCGRGASETSGVFAVTASGGGSLYAAGSSTPGRSRLPGLDDPLIQVVRCGRHAWFLDKEWMVR